MKRLWDLTYISDWEKRDISATGILVVEVLFIALFNFSVLPTKPKQPKPTETRNASRQKTLFWCGASVFAAIFRDLNICHFYTNYIWPPGSIHVCSVPSGRVWSYKAHTALCADEWTSGGLNRAGHSDEGKHPPDSSSARLTLCELVCPCVSACPLSCEYLRRLKEASSKPGSSVSSALICRRTCLWRAGLGLCFCWTYSPESSRGGEGGEKEKKKDKASHLYIFFAPLRVPFFVIFRVITSLNSDFPWGAAAHTNKNKTKKKKRQIQTERNKRIWWVRRRWRLFYST